MSAALRSSLAPSAAASLLRQSRGRAAEFAKARRGKFRTGRRRKSRARSWLSGRVSLGSGRDADGRRLRSHVVSACRRGVAQARGCPTARVSAESQRQFGCWWSSLVSQVAKVSGPGCKHISAANLLGRAGKFATAQRGKSVQRGEESQPRRLYSWGVACRRQVVKHRLGLCGRAWYSIFVVCQKSPSQLGSFAKASRSQPSFQPIFFVQRQVCAHAAG